MGASAAPSLASGRAPLAFHITDIALDAGELAACLSGRLPLRPVSARMQELYYLDTEDDALFRNGGVLIAKPLMQGWSLIREQARSGRPVASCLVKRLPEQALYVPDGPLREQLLAATGEQPLMVRAAMHLRRQALAAVGEAARLLLESAVSDERLVGRRLLLPRQPRPDQAESSLLEALSGMGGLVPLEDRSWYPLLRPELLGR